MKNKLIITSLIGIAALFGVVVASCGHTKVEVSSTAVPSSIPTNNPRL